MNGWKVFAIILLVTNVLTISGTVFLAMLGTSMIENEDICMYNICEAGQTYFYDYTNKMCYCYEDHEIVTTEKVVS